MNRLLDRILGKFMEVGSMRLQLFFMHRNIVNLNWKTKFYL